LSACCACALPADIPKAAIAAAISFLVVVMMGSFPLMSVPSGRRAIVARLR
jgi:hypothetical protein